jgi:hypothetical protein
VFVAILQLIIADNSGAAMAQNFNMPNLEEQLKERQLQQNTPPDFNVGRSNQRNTARPEHVPYSVRHEHKKQ